MSQSKYEYCLDCMYWHSKSHLKVKHVSWKMQPKKYFNNQTLRLGRTNTNFWVLLIQPICKFGPQKNMHQPSQCDCVLSVLQYASKTCSEEHRLLFYPCAAADHPAGCRISCIMSAYRNVYHKLFILKGFIKGNPEEKTNLHLSNKVLKSPLTKHLTPVTSVQQPFSTEGFFFPLAAPGCEYNSLNGKKNVCEFSTDINLQQRARPSF